MFLTTIKTHDSSTVQELLWDLDTDGPGKVSFTDFNNIGKVGEKQVTWGELKASVSIN